jgi:type IV pilus assembly protein PilA
MHAKFRSSRRGFTLVELMIVVAVIGILAALSLTGMRRYLTSSKASEAKSIVGALSRAAHGAYQREQAQAQTVAEGVESVQLSYQLCGDAIPVPGAAPAGRKYQPDTNANVDFQTGDDVNGWTCLKFQVNQPIQYQFLYTRGGSPAAPLSPTACLGGGINCYEAGALGDLNGNGLNSRLARTGHVNVATGELKAATQIYVDNVSE